MTDVSILDPITEERVQDLIRTNLASRDGLYAAADQLSGAAVEKVCRRLAEELGGNAAALAQLLLTRGVKPVGPDDELELKSATSWSKCSDRRRQTKKSSLKSPSASTPQGPIRRGH